MCDSGAILCTQQVITLIKKKIKFSSYIRNSEWSSYKVIYEEAVSHICLCNCSVLNFLVYEETLIFFSISVVSQHEPATLYTEQYMETTKMTFPILSSSIIFGLIISSDSDRDYGEIETTKKRLSIVNLLFFG
jgi:hypothetical protein